MLSVATRDRASSFPSGPPGILLPFSLSCQMLPLCTAAPQGSTGSTRLGRGGALPRCLPASVSLAAAEAIKSSLFNKR